MRAASNAYSRGDHVSARQLSVRAQKEWVAANKLNHKAAEEILHARNSQDDRWKLDLHGLHASEAVKALAQHLHVLESEIRNHHTPPTPNPSLQRQSVSQRQSILQVITGMHISFCKTTSACKHIYLLLRFSCSFQRHTEAFNQFLAHILWSSF